MSLGSSRATSRATALRVGLLLASACGGTGQPGKAATATRPPRLEDAFAGTPPFLIVVRPRALMKDKVYGPVLRRASALAAAHAGVAAVGATALAAFERTDTVVVAMGEGREGVNPNDALVALEGVPADLDPVHLADTEGHTLWHLVGQVRDVTEYSSEQTPGRAVLFVLPERTWVIAAEESIRGARSAFAHPTGERPPALEPEEGELLRVELGGATLRRADEGFAEGTLAPIGRKLQRGTLSLAAGGQGMVFFKLAYPDANTAAIAEERATEVIQAFRHRLDQTQTVDAWSWLAAAGVGRGAGEEAARVTVRVPIPRSWLDGLAEAGLPASNDAADAGPPDTSWWHLRLSRPGGPFDSASPVR